jgi:aspartate aminotransferase-like enzyme
MEAFKAAPISHRSDQFIEDLRDVKRMLCRLVDAKYVELFQGSGTLANDVVATELSLLDSRGLVLSNGEFGDRLIDHATRHDIRFETIRLKWGDSMDTARIERCLDEHKDIGWLWCVHCETSTGMMNDLQAIAGICDKRNVKVCVDAISSVGTVPVSLGSAHLASCVSGKGIGALPGMAMVFHNSEIPSTGRKVPRYLDLAYYGAAEGVPFTFSSNLLYATQAALRRLDPIRRFKSIKKLTAWFRGEVRKHGFTILLPDDLTSPAVTTIVCPQQISSRQVGRQLEERGCLLSYNSEYLVKRNWLQVCLMGECSQDDLEWAWGQVCEVTGRDAA